jgi:AraC-like DNA-binding protein
MLRSPITVPIAFVQGMLAGALRQGGVPLEPLLDAAGIDPSLLHTAGARVTAEQYVALFKLLIGRMNDEALGLLSRRLRPGSFALVIRSALGAPSLDVAMHRVARSFGLLQDDVAFVCLNDGERAGLGLVFTKGFEVPHNFLHELLLRVFWRLLAWLHGGRLTPLGFDLAFDRPNYAAGYGKVLPGLLQFGQPQSALWFEAEALGVPVRRDEAALLAFLKAAPGNVIEPHLADQAVSARTRELLQQSVPAWPDLSSVADGLHMSTSTLQRHLAAEGTSFQSLKDLLRRDLAIVRLNTSAVPLAALAAELGFADSAAFQRAFKTWTGSAPGSYRRRGVE